MTDGPELADDRRWVDDLPSALDSLDEVLPEDGGVALFLDFDGTLAPIVAHPDLAALSRAAASVLRRLAGVMPVAVVSGRELADIRDRVGLDAVVYAGAHGFDIAGPNGMAWERPLGSRFLPALDAAEAELRIAIDGRKGAWLERKRFSIALHLRQCGEVDAGALREAVQAVLARHPALRATPGKALLELQPDVDWDKGQAVLWLIDTLAIPDDVRPIFIGDDITDEDAFAALDRRGVGIVVRDDNRRTSAQYRLDGPEEVERFLVAVAERIEGD